MLCVMIFVVVGPHSPAKCLVGAAVLIVASIGLAPSARRRVSARLAIADYWAMAGAMLVLLPHTDIGDSPNLHTHGDALQAPGLPVFLAIVAVWALVRVIAGVRIPDARGRASVVGAVLTAIGFVVTFAFCR
jgi:hypothetical protein